MTRLRQEVSLAREQERLRDLHRAQTDLWYLATEIIGFDLLTRDFHKPMMDRMDESRAAYQRAVFNRSAIMNEHDMWSRDYYKTTVGIAQACQDYLVNPRWTNTWWHAVEDMAVEAGVAVGKIIQENKEYRRLMGVDVSPSTRARKFVTAKGFNLRCNTDKAPSMRMLGSGSEATGGHSMGGYLDDIIGLNTIEDNLMPKIRRWMGLTVRNVIRTDLGWMRGKGTRWDSNDIYSDWLKSKRWNVHVRSCYETDGVPDWNGEPVLYTREAIEAKRSEMSRFEFSCQMMNDPLPDTERLWNQHIEQDLFVSRREAMLGTGRCAVLSDPAPANVGSFRGEGEKLRADGSKDEWTVATVRFQLFQGRQRAVLLELRGSRDWPMTEGLAECCRQMMKYRTNRLYVEMYGGLIPEMTERAKKAARVNNVSLYTERDGRLPQFANSYAAGAKNIRFEALCDWARDGRFVICDDINPDDLDLLLEQTRNWRVVKGRNSLRFDDRADVVSRCTDAALQTWAPQVAAMMGDPDWDDDDDPVDYRSKYCGI